MGQKSSFGNNSEKKKEELSKGTLALEGVAKKAYESIKGGILNEVKISRLDLEILQNIQIMQSMIRPNVSQTINQKKMKERSWVMKFESNDDIKALKKERNGFDNVESSERRKSKGERQNIWSLKKANLGRKKVKERSRVMKSESKNYIKASRKKNIHFDTVGKNRDVASQRRKMRRERRNFCPLNKANLGPIIVNSKPVDILTLKDGELNFVKPGGQWTPTGCIPRAEVAVIVPFRKRDEHLGIFLRHMHKFLKTQMIRYRIFIVEQDDEYEFNRGKLMNIGFREALKMYPFNCVVFHDIDLMPEDTRNDYACPHSPRHVSVAIDKFHYTLPYEQIFGGVEMFLTQDFKVVNGFSNSFWGWGGEDDNLYFRVMSIFGHLTRPSLTVGRYQMLKHFDMENFKPPDREEELRRSQNTKYISLDGLSSLQYKVNRILALPLFTVIKADLQKHEDTLLGDDELV